MKFNIYSIAFLIIIFSLSCTKEKKVTIAMTPPPGIILDSAYTVATIPSAQAKNIYLEEFSGVHCPNCPSGSLKVKEIEALYPNRMVSVTLHNTTDPLARPYLTSQFANAQDFRLKEANEISSQLGPYAAMPCLAVDRVFFPDASASGERYITNRNLWKTKVDTQLTKPCPVNIELKVLNWSASSRVATLQVNAVFTQNNTNAPNISVMVVEDKIISVQENPTGDVENYEHHNIVRSMLTPALGKAVGTTNAGSAVLYKFLTPALPSTWHEEKIKFVVFISETIGAKPMVLQSQEISLIP